MDDFWKKLTPEEISLLKKQSAYPLDLAKKQARVKNPIFEDAYSPIKRALDTAYESGKRSVIKKAHDVRRFKLVDDIIKRLVSELKSESLRKKPRGAAAHIRKDLNQELLALGNTIPKTWVPGDDSDKAEVKRQINRIAERIREMS